MSAFVIYDTILIGGIVSVIEYKGEEFVDQDKCLHYLVKENKHIYESLDKHLKQTYRSGASVLYIGCSQRGNFTGQNETI